jgi:hypothetical protein
VGSVVVGGVEAPSAGGGSVSVGVGDGSSVGGGEGLGAGRGVFFRFTVFLPFSFLSSWARISPTYTLLQIADKALIFDCSRVYRVAFSSCFLLW